MTFKNGKNPYEWVKYDWDEPPQPQLLRFCDLVGVGIAPVSTKTAVKYKYFKPNTYNESPSYFISTNSDPNLTEFVTSCRRLLQSRATLLCDWERILIE